MTQFRWPTPAEWGVAREGFADALTEYHDIKGEGLSDAEAGDALDPPEAVLASFPLSAWWACQRLWVQDPGVVLMGGVVAALFLGGAALRLLGF